MHPDSALKADTPDAMAEVEAIDATLNWPWRLIDSDTSADIVFDLAQAVDRLQRQWAALHQLCERRGEA